MKKTLKQWEEILGQLQSITQENETVIIELANVMHLVIPSDIIALEQLQGSVGKRISILRTDIESREYLWRYYDD